MPKWSNILTDKSSIYVYITGHVLYIILKVKGLWAQTIPKLYTQKIKAKFARSKTFPISYTFGNLAHAHQYFSLSFDRRTLLSLTFKTAFSKKIFEFLKSCVRELNKRRSGWCASIKEKKGTLRVSFKKHQRGTNPKRRVSCIYRKKESVHIHRPFSFSFTWRKMLAKKGVANIRHVKGFVCLHCTSFENAFCKKTNQRGSRPNVH